MRRLVRNAIHAVFVVPDVQVYQLDFEFQYYAFHLFHQSPANRLAHAIGLPVTIASVYAVTAPWLAWSVLAYVTGVQLVLATHHRLLALVPLVLALNALLWLLARRLLQPLDVSILLPIVAAILAYLGHAAESRVPPPFSPSHTFAPWREWITRSPWPWLLFAVLCGPTHVLVEAISAPRNVLVLLVLAARAAGLAPSGVDTLARRAAAVAALPEPPLTRAEYRSVLRPRDAAVEPQPARAPDIPQPMLESTR